VAARRAQWEKRLGHLVVYPGQGVARIEELRTQEIAGRTHEFLVLRMTEDDSRILIPREKIDDVGLRSVVGRSDADRIWEILRTRTRRRRRAGVTWSRQFREYQDKLKHGTVFEIAEVLRDLLRLQAEKELSFGERRMLDSAQSLVVQELAAAQQTGTETIEQEIRALPR
jgi:CarD family transcriptional regulator